MTDYFCHPYNMWPVEFPVIVHTTRRPAMLPAWMFMKMILLMTVMIVSVVTVLKGMRLSEEKIPTVTDQWRKRITYTHPLVVGKEREG